MSKRVSSNGATMSGCHHRRMGTRRQAQVDREAIMLQLQSIIDFGTASQRREALEALRWLQQHGGHAYNPPPRGRR